MRYLAVVLITFCTDVFADQVKIEIPGRSWSAQFEAPALTKLEESSEGGTYRYRASAGRLNLSLIVEAPGCSGGDSKEDNYKCFAQKIDRVPGLVKQTYSAVPGKRAIEVGYLMRVATVGGPVPVMNLHVLFAHKGA